MHPVVQVFVELPHQVRPMDFPVIPGFDRMMLVLTLLLFFLV
jgi:hypothetical protein